MYVFSKASNAGMLVTPPLWLYVKYTLNYVNNYSEDWHIILNRYSWWILKLHFNNLQYNFWESS